MLYAVLSNARAYLWFCGPDEFCLRFEQVHRQRYVRLSLSRQKLDFFPPPVPADHPSPLPKEDLID